MKKDTEESIVRINVFCPDEALNYGLPEWSLQTRPDQENVGEQFPIAIATGLRKAFDRVGVHRAYAPKIIPKGVEIIDARALKMQINLGAGRFLYRSCPVSADAVKAGGMFLDKGCTLIMNTNDFPIVVATAKEHMIIAHATCDSLIDREGVATRRPTRRHSSIVHAIVEAFIEKKITPREIEMHMLFSIPKEKCKYALNNSGLAEFISNWCPEGVEKRKEGIFLDLEKIFLSQAHMMGIGIQNIHIRNPIVNHPAISHAFDGKKNPSIDGRETKRKNLVVIKRYAA